MILTIRTDKPEAEIGLFDDNAKQVQSKQWPAGRELSDTLLLEIENMLGQSKREFSDLTGTIVFKGPGSFTGLRIGITVANTLAYGLSIPIVSESGDDWIKVGIRRLRKGDNEISTLPEYGGEANVTSPRK